MSSPASEPRIPLRLRPDEQWLLHHVLADRIEAARRSPRSTDPAIEVLQAFKKVEEGTHLFTPAELLNARSKLVEYGRRRGVDDADRRAVGRLVDRIDDAFDARPELAPRE